MERPVARKVPHGIHTDRRAGPFRRLSAKKGGSKARAAHSKAHQPENVMPRRAMMPRGDKSAYTDKQKRKAQHIEDSYESRGVPEAEAEKRAWATVNKESGGGNKSGSGRGKPDTHVSSSRGGGRTSPALPNSVARLPARVG
jgi:plasmid stabilization system protein ParE